MSNTLTILYRTYRVDLHNVIAMGYTALYQITAIYGQTKKRLVAVTSVMRRSKVQVSCITGRAFTSIFVIDLNKIYNMLLVYLQ